MEETTQKSILNNANVSTQPVTTWFGRIIILVEIILFLIQQTMPPVALLFGVEKEIVDVLIHLVSYPWYIHLSVLSVGVLFLYLNETYFKELFGIGTGYLKKKSE